ncbi:TolC family protein [Myxococcota bacterium]|nr:TolC family protein [Myxococcota bacterium]
MTLDAAFARTRERSEELRALDERIVEAELNVDRAWALLKPTWNASFTFTHTEPKPPPFALPAFPDLSSDEIRTACATNGSGVIVDPTGCVEAVVTAFSDTIGREPRELDFFKQDTSTFSTTINWNVFNGRALPTLANAKDSVLLERDRTKVNVRDVMIAVARAYYGAAATKQAITAAERARARARAELAIVERQAELGETVPARLVAARVAASQAEHDVARVANLHQQALSALYLVTRSEDERPDVTIPPEPVRPAGSKDELVKLAWARREDLRAASTAITIAERSEDEVWWRFAPTLSLFANYRYSNVEGLSGQNAQWGFGVAATMLLYDGGLRYAELASAESRVRTAMAALAGLRARVASDVERAMLGLEASEIAVARARDAIILAKTRADVTAAQYEAGALRTIELKEANDAVLDAELALIRAELDRQLGVLELQRAVGSFEP